MLKFAGHPNTNSFELYQDIGFGLGEDFEKIQKFISEQTELLKNQISLSDLLESIKQTIISLRENSKEDCEYADDNAIANAINFIECLPLDVKMPNVLADGDLGVAFEWRTNSRDILIVTFTPDDKIVYACLESDGEFHGSKAFEKQKIPDVLLSSIRRISIL